MANRHKKAKGGSVKEPFYEGGESNVAKEAKERKRGGRAFKTGGSVPGFKSGGRLDKRARGGKVGADKTPFSSAHRGVSPG